MANWQGKTSYSEGELDDLRTILPDFLKDDGTPNVFRLAARLGVARVTVTRKLNAIKLADVNRRETEYTPDVPALDIGDVKPRVRIRAYNPLSVHDLPVRKVLAIGDKHWQPGYICKEADAIAMLPGWENSKGARAEWTLSIALGHTIIYL